MLNDELANDRTFLAWLRTGVAVIGLGFVVAKVALIVEANTDEAFYTSAGVVLVLCGAALIVMGYAQHKRGASDLRPEDLGPPSRWAAAVTTMAVAAGLMLATLIVVTT
jgi:putative membrane protein